MLPILLISSRKESVEQFIDQLIQELNILPYFIYKISPLKEEITIDQVRSIKKELMTQNKNMRLVILYDFHKANLEAQNAFLKTLEEKNEANQFVLTAVNERSILPTIRSRVRRVSLDSGSDKKQVSAETFQLIESLKSETKGFLLDPHVIGITRERAVQLFDELIIFLHDRVQKNNLQAARLLKKLLEYKSLLQNNNLNPQLTVDNFLLELLTFVRQLD